jgi:hypothetical protein
MLTPSPSTSSVSIMTSPRLTPIRYSIVAGLYPNYFLDTTVFLSAL